jgi:hypothetical protein
MFQNIQVRKYLENESLSSHSIIMAVDALVGVDIRDQRSGFRSMRCAGSRVRTFRGRHS